MIINVTHRRDMPFDIDNTSSYTVEEDEDDEEDEDNDEDNDDNGEDNDEVTISSSRQSLLSTKSQLKSQLKSNSSKPHKKEVDMRDDESIPSYLVAGEIALPEKDNESKRHDDTNSTYSVTLLSHRDMLSSRLSKLGF